MDDELYNNFSDLMDVTKSTIAWSKQKQGGGVQQRQVTHETVIL